MLGRSSLRGFNVLVVEDDADTQEAIRNILEREGAAVVTAGSAPEGLVLHAGFQAYLTKPVEPTGLVTTVAGLTFKSKE